MMRKYLLTAGMAAVLAVTACTTREPGVALFVPQFFGPDSYKGLTIGMSKPDALATGRLGKEPTSKLYRCEDHSYTGGPKPDPARMAAEQAAERKAEEVKNRLDEANRNHKPLGANASLDDLRKNADALVGMSQILQESIETSRQVTALNATRNVIFLDAGGVSFDSMGQLRLIAAPPEAKTTAGVGIGSSVDEVKRAHPDVLLEEQGDYELPVAGKPGQRMVFRMTPEDKVRTMLLISASGC
jgi:hypothetical protein